MAERTSKIDEIHHGMRCDREQISLINISFPSLTSSYRDKGTEGKTQASLVSKKYLVNTYSKVTERNLGTELKCLCDCSASTAGDLKPQGEEQSLLALFLLRAAHTSSSLM